MRFRCPCAVILVLAVLACRTSQKNSNAKDQSNPKDPTSIGSLEFPKNSEGSKDIPSPNIDIRPFSIGPLAAMNLTSSNGQGQFYRLTVCRDPEKAKCQQKDFRVPPMILVAEEDGKFHASLANCNFPWTASSENCGPSTSDSIAQNWSDPTFAAIKTRVMKIAAINRQLGRAGEDVFNALSVYRKKTNDKDGNQQATTLVDNQLAMGPGLIAELISSSVFPYYFASFYKTAPNDPNKNVATTSETQSGSQEECPAPTQTTSPAVTSPACDTARLDQMEKDIAKLKGQVTVRGAALVSLGSVLIVGGISVFIAHRALSAHLTNGLVDEGFNSVKGMMHKLFSWEADLTPDMFERQPGRNLLTEHPSTHGDPGSFYTNPSNEVEYYRDANGKFYKAGDGLVRLEGRNPTAYSISYDEWSKLDSRIRNDYSPDTGLSAQKVDTSMTGSWVGIENVASSSVDIHSTSYRMRPEQFTANYVQIGDHIFRKTQPYKIDYFPDLTPETLNRLKVARLREPLNPAFGKGILLISPNGSLIEPPDLWKGTGVEQNWFEAGGLLRRPQDFQRDGTNFTLEHAVFTPDKVKKSWNGYFASMVVDPWTAEVDLGIKQELAAQKVAAVTGERTTKIVTIGSVGAVVAGGALIALNSYMGLTESSLQTLIDKLAKLENSILDLHKQREEELQHLNEWLKTNSYKPMESDEWAYHVLAIDKP